MEDGSLSTELGLYSIILYFQNQNTVKPLIHISRRRTPTCSHGSSHIHVQTLHF